ASGTLSPFFVLTGDANHDRFVNTMDFTALAQNFGKSNMNYAQGDFNYDGKVNALDFNALATRFGAHLAAAGPLVASLPTATAAAFAAAPAPTLFSDTPVTKPESGPEQELNGVL